MAWFYIYFVSLAHQRLYPEDTCRTDMWLSGQRQRSSCTPPAASHWSCRKQQQHSSLHGSSVFLSSGLLVAKKTDKQTKIIENLQVKLNLGTARTLDGLAFLNCGQDVTLLEEQKAVHFYCIMYKCKDVKVAAPAVFLLSFLRKWRKTYTFRDYSLNAWPVDGADGGGEICLQFSDEAFSQTLNTGLFCALQQQHTISRAHWKTNTVQIWKWDEGQPLGMAGFHSWQREKQFDKQARCFHSIT